MTRTGYRFKRGAQSSARHIGAAFKALSRKAPLERGPALTVIMPAYNDEAYVERAVKSCFGQNYANLELVCVDDGSTDATLSILQRLSDEAGECRMKVIALERNSGPHAARRAGLLEAEGEIIVFLDSDDELASGACIEIGRQFQEKPFDILHFASIIRRDGVADVGQAAAMARWTMPVAGELREREILTRTFVDLDYAFNVCGKAYRASVVKRAFDTLGQGKMDFGEDALEYFAIAFFSRLYRGIPSRRLYVYHLGDGASARRNLTVEEFERSLRGIRSVEAMRAFLVRQGAFHELAPVYEAHRAGQLGALLRSWRYDVREDEREEAMRRILQLWPEDEVVDAMCDLGTEAVEMLREFLGSALVLTDDQRYRCGVADGAAHARAEYESSISYRIGRLATHVPRTMKDYLLK